MAGTGEAERAATAIMLGLLVTVDIRSATIRGSGGLICVIRAGVEASVQRRQLGT